MKTETPQSQDYQQQVLTARKILLEGLDYFEYDGHTMPKSVAREALEAIGVPRSEQGIL